MTVCDQLVCKVLVKGDKGDDALLGTSNKTYTLSWWMCTATCAAQQQCKSLLHLLCCAVDAAADGCMTCSATSQINCYTKEHGPFGEPVTGSLGTKQPSRPKQTK
jgi:hypothetical protein